METERLKKELLFKLENSSTEIQERIKEALGFIDEHFEYSLDDSEIDCISGRYKDDSVIMDAIRCANVTSVDKKELLQAIKEMFDLQVDPHRKEIKDEIFDSIYWIKDNMPDTLSDKDLDIIAKRYGYNGEILNAINNLE